MAALLAAALSLVACGVRGGLAQSHLQKVDGLEPRLVARRTEPDVTRRLSQRVWRRRISPLRYSNIGMGFQDMACVATTTNGFSAVDGHELFDQEADPAAARNVASARPEVVARLRGEICERLPHWHHPILGRVGLW